MEELFAKVPARRKFLAHGAAANMPPVWTWCGGLAMARADIGFALETVGDAGKRKRCSACKAGEELATRVARIIAHELKDNSVAIETGA